MLSVSLRYSLGEARTKAEQTVKLALLIEADVLLSILAATVCVLLKSAAPETEAWGRATAAVSWAYIYISISASWAIAGRFVSEHSEWSLSRASSTVMILAPSALAPPAVCAAILPYTFPQYTRTWALLHFAVALFPAIAIALFTQPSSTSSPAAASSSPISPSLLLRPALAYRSAKPLPIRVALLRGARFPARKPFVHPLIKKRQFKPKSPLKSEAFDWGRVNMASGTESWV